MCVMAAPRRGRKSRWFSWLYLHWTSTDSMPPLSRLVPGDTEQMYIKSSVLFHKVILSQNDQIILDCPFKNSCSGLKNGRIIKVSTFWGEAQRADGAVVPVQGGVCVLLLVVEVSPKRMNIKHKKNKVSPLWHSDTHWLIKTRMGNISSYMELSCFCWLWQLLWTIKERALKPSVTKISNTALIQYLLFKNTKQKLFHDELKTHRWL